MNNTTVNGPVEMFLKPLEEIIQYMTNLGFEHTNYELGFGSIAHRFDMRTLPDEDKGSYIVVQGGIVDTFAGTGQFLLCAKPTHADVVIHGELIRLHYFLEVTDTMGVFRRKLPMLQDWLYPAEKLVKL